jgi:hypothetical protein
MCKEAKPGGIQGVIIFQIWYSIENYFRYFSLFNGSSINQAVRSRPVCPEAKFCTRFKICKICGLQIGTATGLSFSTTVFSLDYQSAIAPHLSLFRRTSGISFPMSGNINVESFFIASQSVKDSSGCYQKYLLNI